MRDLLERDSVYTREIFEKAAIERYVQTGHAFTGGTTAKSKEIVERLNELIRRLRAYPSQKYELKLSPNSAYCSYMICDNTLIVDVGRQIGKRFQGNLSGVLSTRKKVVDIYEADFDRQWNQIIERENSDRNLIIEWLESLVRDVEQRQTH